MTALFDQDAHRRADAWLNAHRLTAPADPAHYCPGCHTHHQASVDCPAPPARPGLFAGCSAWDVALSVLVAGVGAYTAWLYVGGAIVAVGRWIGGW